MTSLFSKSNVGVRAPEFPPRLPWFNTKPLTLALLKGHVVLVDFWTYSCVNCLRTLPHVREWNKRYVGKGLVIVGVHTPEFDFEKVAANVKAAIKEQKVTYPVVLDSDYKVWNAYANHWWPRKILIDHMGKIVYDHVGEGEYAQTERAIQAALRKIGARRLPKVTGDESKGGVYYPLTPEVYLGVERGHFANATVEVGHTLVYRRPSMQSDRPALEGAWKVEREYAQSQGGRLLMPYMAGEVNLVMGVELGAKVKKAVVKVTLDGKSLIRAQAGDDVTFAKKESIVAADAPRMYRLVLSKKHHEGTLELDIPEGIRLFAFTFGGACS